MKHLLTSTIIAVLKGIKSFMDSLFYDPPITTDRYRECWKCSHGKIFVIFDFGVYCGQGDYTNHIKCEVFPCVFIKGEPKEVDNDYADRS